MFVISFSNYKLKIILALLFIVVLFLVVIIPDGNANPMSCHPEPNPTHTQYIIGYGSLMNEVSKRRTDPNVGESIPIRVKGFQRVWNARGESKSLNKTTFLGINEDPTGTLNAVAFMLPSSDNDDSIQEILKKYDDREEYYCRRRVRLDHVEFLVPGTEFSHLSDVWIYVTVPNAKYFPNTEYPIAQTYADTFLTGCLDLEEKFKNNLDGFLNECIRSTQGWSDFCIDNRNLEKAKSPKIQDLDKIVQVELPGKLPCQVKASNQSSIILLHSICLILSLVTIGIL